MTVEIRSTNGGVVAVVDDEDADLANFGWHAKKHGNTYYFSATRIKPTTFLHRVVLSRMLGRVPERKEETDHIDGDGCNNRRGNLRVTTRSQNMMNRRKFKGCTSQYTGVCIHKPSGRWHSYIYKDKRRYDLGRYANEDDAARAYDRAAKTLHGPFARLNFPENDQ